jgi:hypothetical protein
MPVQTFGFALFYLRGIAPKEVKSSDIYWGAVPWLGLQLIMAAIVILWPGLVTMWLQEDKPVDLDKVRIEVPVPEFVPPDPSQFLTPDPGPAAPPQPAGEAQQRGAEPAPAPQ